MSDADAAGEVVDGDDGDGVEDDSTPDADVGTDVDLDFGDDGLVPAVAQDAETGEVLMLAYATREALARTAETGRAHYYSRSREELWEKGATSGHTQAVEEIRVDCDGDAVLYLVEQAGGACHTGYRSCFYRRLDGSVVGDRVFDPDDVY
jgi:phosphoribosyl-AMP cyclohydrolase